MGKTTGGLIFEHWARKHPAILPHDLSAVGFRTPCPEAGVVPALAQEPYWKRVPLSRRTRRPELATQPEPFDQRLVAALVLPLDIVKQATAL